MGSGIIGYYIAYQKFGASIQTSAAIATLSLCLGISLSATTLSILTGSGATLSNISFSCGLILLCVLFFGLCAIVGALAAAVLLSI